MKYILVTGVGGGVGQYIAQRLCLDGYPILGIYRNSKPLEYSYELIHADLAEDRVAMKDVDTIVHIAATINGNTQKLINDNINSTMNLLANGEQNKIRRFIYISTVSVYGSVKGELNENSNIVNPGPYGLTKYIAENLVRESNIKEKLIIELPRMLGPFVNLNNIHGSGFLTMTKKILNNEDVNCFIPNTLYNNYMHVSDLACFMEMLLDSRKWKECDKVLLGAKNIMPMMQILQIMKESIGSSSRILATDRGLVPNCALVSISKALQMGYTPMESKEVLSCFMKELNQCKVGLGNGV